MEVDCRKMRDRRSSCNVKFMGHIAKTNGFFTSQKETDLRRLLFACERAINQASDSQTQRWASASPRGPMKTQIARPTCRIPDSVDLEWAREFTFLASTQGMLLLGLLVPGPHSEKLHTPLN